MPPGNRITTYSSLTEQLLEDAVHQVSLQTEGDWDDVKALFLKWAALPENDAVGREVFDGSGKYRGPSDSTIQRRWGKVDKFVKYANTYGPGPAQEKFGIYIRQVLPDSALDTVDVDWTQADVTALDDVTVLRIDADVFARVLLDDRHAAQLIEQLAAERRRANRGQG